VLTERALNAHWMPSTLSHTCLTSHKQAQVCRPPQGRARTCSAQSACGSRAWLAACAASAPPPSAPPPASRTEGQPGAGHAASQPGGPASCAPYTTRASPGHVALKPRRPHFLRAKLGRPGRSVLPGGRA